MVQDCDFPPDPGSVGFAGLCFPSLPYFCKPFLQEHRVLQRIRLHSSFLQVESKKGIQDKEVSRVLLFYNPERKQGSRAQPCQ